MKKKFKSFVIILIIFAIFIGLVCGITAFFIKKYFHLNIPPGITGAISGAIIGVISGILVKKVLKQNK